jgi:hypothetical protein
MEADKGIRGWAAALTVGLVLTLVLLVVEKHLRIPTQGFFRAPGTSQVAAASTQQRGIMLAVDPGLVAIEQFPPADRTPLARRDSNTLQQHTAQYLRTPPEPAAQVVLRAPTSVQLAVLPLSSSTANIDYLMDAMDRAFDSPMKTVSIQREIPETKFDHSAFQRLASLPAPALASNRLPEPRSLYRQLDELRAALGEPVPHLVGIDRDAGSDVSVANLGQVRMGAAGRSKTHMLSHDQLTTLVNWVGQVESTLNQLVRSEAPDYQSLMDKLDQLEYLSKQSTPVANELTDSAVGKLVNRIAYSIDRRVAVWRSVEVCLRSGNATMPSHNTEDARQQIQTLISSISRKIAGSGDEKGWRKYLMLDELQAWAEDDNEVWNQGNNIAINVLSRLRWQRIDEEQRRFLNQPEFIDLAAHLTAWARDPVDYRQLLNDLELLEEDPINRVRGSLASAVQVLRLSNEPHQQAVADALNDHYRNANVRLAISNRFLERFLPDESYQVRPVRQRILGADTSGDSTVRTKLNMRLVPDETAWHVVLGVDGNLESKTRSSKGPAVFHNTSQAQVSSQRTIRMDPFGYKVSTNGTDVESQQQLRKMSTDFDGLPVVGDFLRVVIREQFDQQRGMAKRVMHRMIANETDQEMDKQLQEKLQKAQLELQRRLIGPLEMLNLNPMIVAMSTTEDRLMIRYRVANQDQMASNTARPRAPTDSLLSMQIHQSTFNNTISQLGLGERNWNLVELFQRIANVFGQENWNVPADIPQDVTIRFAPSRPVSVEFVDDKMMLTLRIAELAQGSNKIERFIVRTSYVPVADGMKAGLVREGVVSIDGSRLTIRDRLPLRAIFAKVFVARSEIPLISDSWGEDNRTDGLAVSQIEIRDGWMAVAISNDTSPLAAEVAARSRQHDIR